MDAATIAPLALTPLDWQTIKLGTRIALAVMPDQFNPVKISMHGTVKEICRDSLKEMGIRSCDGAWPATDAFKLEDGTVRRFAYWLAFAPVEDVDKKEI